MLNTCAYEIIAHMCIYVKYMYVFVTKRKFLLLRQVSFGATPKLGISTSTSTAENLFVDPKGFEVGSPSFPTQLMRVALPLCHTAELAHRHHRNLTNTYPDRY